VGNPSRTDELALHPLVTLKAFDKWEIKFVGMINPPVRRSRDKYIITMIEYLNRWEEETSVIDCTMKTGFHQQVQKEREKAWHVLALCKKNLADRKMTEVTVSTKFRVEALSCSTQRGLCHVT
jgi:hypothetical protein